MDPAAPFLIAGGGIAGLATGLALAKCGLAAHILERRPEPSEAGAGIQIGPNGVHALAALGVLDDLLPLAGRPHAIRVRDGASGRLLQELPLGAWIEARHGAPYLVAHRRDLQAALLAGVAREPRISLTYGCEIVALEPGTDSVKAIAADGRTIEGIALIGADGAFSNVRWQMTPGHGPRFTHRTAARAVLDASRATLLVDAGTTGVWLSPGAHVVHYPVRAGREIAIVVVLSEDWQERGWSTAIDRDTVARALAPFAAGLRDVLVEAPDWRRWALFDAEPLAHLSEGRIVLAGDAAHPVLPFLAQGGCLALEDALALAAAVQAAPGDIPAAFRAYEHARKDRAAAIMRGARRNGRIYHLDGIARVARDLTLRLAPPERVMAHYDWIYGWRPPTLRRT